MLTGGAASFSASFVASFSLVDMASDVRDDRWAPNVRGTPNPSAPYADAADRTARTAVPIFIV